MKENSLCKFSCVTCVTYYTPSQYSYDCDEFTREYYSTNHNIEQPIPISISKPSPIPVNQVCDIQHYVYNICYITTTSIYLHVFVYLSIYIYLSIYLPF